MTFIEFLGFVITLLALIILSWRRSREERKARMEEEIPDDVRELMEAMGLQVEEPKPPPKPPKPSYRPAYTSKRTLSQEFALHSTIEERGAENRIEQRHMQNAIEGRGGTLGKGILSPAFPPLKAEGAKRMRKTSLVRGKLQSLGSLPNLLVYREIFDAPKALRPEGMEPWERERS